jgi:hypothetical protein
MTPGFPFRAFDRGCEGRDSVEPLPEDLARYLTAGSSRGTSARLDDSQIFAWVSPSAVTRTVSP